MIALVVYPLVTTALYYLGAWALITRWLWSRYPPVLGALMTCAACSGFWYGLAAGWALRDALPFPGGPRLGVVLAGLCSMVWTPVFARRMITDLQDLHPASEDVPENPQT